MNHAMQGFTVLKKLDLDKTTSFAEVCDQAVSYHAKCLTFHCITFHLPHPQCSNVFATVANVSKEIPNSC